MKGHVGRNEDWPRARNPWSRQHASARRRRLRPRRWLRAIAESFDYAGSVRLPDPSSRAVATLGVVGSYAVQRFGCHPIWAMRQRATDTNVFQDGVTSCSSNDRHAGTARVPRAGGPNRFFVGTRSPFGMRC